MKSIQIVLLMVTSCMLMVSGNKGTYNYAYNVNDPNTGDVKEQQEVKGHDQVVTGYYKTLDADGLMRTVNYQAHPVTGFQAQVNRDLPSAVAMKTETNEPAIIAMSPSPIMRADSIAASPVPLLNVDCEPSSVTPAAILRNAEVEPSRIYVASPSVEAKLAAPQPLINTIRPVVVPTQMIERTDNIAPAVTWQSRLQAVPAPAIAWKSEKFIENETPILRAKLEPVSMIRTASTTSTIVHDAPISKISAPSMSYSYGPNIQSSAIQVPMPQYYAAPVPLALPEHYAEPAPIALPKYYAAPAPIALPKYYAAPAPMALPKYYAAPAPIASPKYYAETAPMALPKYYAAPAPMALPKYYAAPAPIALPKYYAEPAPIAISKYYATPAPIALPKYYAASAPLMAPLEPKYITTGIKTGPVIAQEPCEK